MARTHAARNRLVLAHQPLVAKIARAIWHRVPWTIELDDLVSVGQLGLIDAAAAFDASRGASFATFATPRVRGKILDSLRKVDWVSRNARQAVKELEQARADLEQQHGRPPTDRQLADRLECSIEALAELQATERLAGEIHSLSAPASAGSDGEKGPLSAILTSTSPTPDPDRILRREELKRIIGKTLNQRDRLIILLYYYEQMTMKEIAATLGIRRSRVSQIHRKTLARLKVAMKGKLL